MVDFIIAYHAYMLFGILITLAITSYYSFEGSILYFARIGFPLMQLQRLIFQTG